MYVQLRVVPSFIVTGWSWNPNYGRKPD